MPLVQTRGAASAQGFGEFAQASAVPNYIEEVFSTYLYTGNDSTQTITNGIDLSGKGGMVFVKGRDIATGGAMIDTVRGVNKNIVTDQNYAQDSDPSVSAFNSTGFSINSLYSFINDTGNKYVSWTFRKQPKFFDVVTWTGNATNRTIAHSLGSVPGSIIIKRTDTAANWAVYHRSLANTQYLVLNTNDAVATGATWWNSTTPTSSVFSLGTNSTVNASGGTYVAYIFAHDAGGFGLTGTDNVISCGSYIGNGLAAGPSINLGYEPQWVMIKHSSGSNDWEMYDNMRGVATGGNDALLRPNTSGAEENTSNILSFTATGFQLTDTFSNTNGSGETYIYIAIRRGPMKVPTVGTSVYNALAWTGNATNPRSLTGVGFTPDNTFFQLPSTGTNWNWYDKLRGATKRLLSNNTVAEATRSTGITSFDMDGITFGADYNNNTFASQTWFFKRAPSFFDEVCYTGVGGTASFSHNLGVAPELMFVKSRSAANGGLVYNKTITASKYLCLFFSGQGDFAVANDTGGFAGVEPTSSVFTVGTYNNVNGSGSTYVAYLFATCAGVSKVGSYTGNGTTQTIDCGFTGGARFVLIKRTDAVGNWYTYDTVRGMTVLTDPYLWLDDTAAQVATLGSVTTVSTGFALNSAILAAINVSAGTYIFLAIA